MAEVEWRAVEHDQSIPVPSEPVAGALEEVLDREVAEVRGLVRPDEASFSLRRPTLHPNGHGGHCIRGCT